jgi:hypothetical protein
MGQVLSSATGEAGRLLARPRRVAVRSSQVLPLSLAVALVLLLAAPAFANEETMRVNELSVAAGKVELLDLSPVSDPGIIMFVNRNGYAVRAYDGAGNEVAAVEFPQPVPNSLRSTPLVLDLPLPAGAGQVCWEDGRNPNDASPIASFRNHCMGYGNVTKPVVRRQRLIGGTFAMPVAPAPGPGQSVQRQACGKAAVAAPTLGADNAEVHAACAGSSPACDDLSPDLRRAKLTVKVPRVHDVDRPLFAKVTLSNNGSISMRGSFYAPLGPIPPTNPNNPQRPPGSFVFGPIARDLKAKRAIRVRIPISRKAKAAVKRAARRGNQTRGFLISVARGTCERARFHSKRQFELVP